MAGSDRNYEPTDIPKDVVAAFIRQKTHEEKVRADAAKPPQRQIKEIFSFELPEVKPSLMDPLYRAEWQLTLAEFQQLMRQHSEEIATIESMKPFRDFLANRWKRINGKGREEREKEEKIREEKIAQIVLQEQQMKFSIKNRVEEAERLVKQTKSKEFELRKKADQAAEKAKSAVQDAVKVELELAETMLKAKITQSEEKITPDLSTKLDEKSAAKKAALEAEETAIKELDNASAEAKLAREQKKIIIEATATEEKKKTNELALAMSKPVSEMHFGTDLVYPYATLHPSTELCMKIRDVIIKETIDQRPFIIADKAKNDNRLKKILEKKRTPRFYLMKTPLSVNEMMESTPEDIYLYRTEMSHVLFIKPKNATGNEFCGYIQLNDKRYEDIPVSLVGDESRFSEMFSDDPKTSKLDSSERNDVLTKLFEKDFFKKHNKDVVESKKITKEIFPVNSLLMPSVLSHYYPAVAEQKSEYIDFDAMALDQFILTDNGEQFIPVRETMLRAAEHVKKTGQIEFTIALSAGRIRKLTASEQQRLLSHSPEVTEYYESIRNVAEHVAKKLARQQQQEKMNSPVPVSIGIILQDFLDGKYGAMTYVEFGEYFLTKSKTYEMEALFSMEAYCFHTDKNGTFKDVVDYLSDTTVRNKKALHLRTFMQRYKWALFQREDLKLIPPMMEMVELGHEPLLDGATEKFKIAMENPLKVNPGYGEPGRQRLIHQLYDESTFSHVVEVMQDALPLADYLQMMPSEKLPAFIRLLSDEKLQNMFDFLDKDNILLEKIWYLGGLNEERKKNIREKLDRDKINQIEKNHSSKEISRNILALSNADIRNYIRSLSNDDLENFFNATQVDISQLSKIWFHLEENQKHSLVSVIQNPERFSAILNSQNETGKKSDYNIARSYFFGMIQTDKTAKILLNRIDQVRNVISSSNLSVLTEFVHRSAIRMQDPENATNNQRYPEIAKQVVDAPWGKILEGAVCFIVGAGLITTAGLLAASTLGVSTPLSASAIYMGITLATAGATALSAGGSLIFWHGYDQLINGRASYRLSKASCRFFAKQGQEELKVPTEPVAVRHSINSVHEDNRHKSMRQSLLKSSRA